MSKFNLFLKHNNLPNAENFKILYDELLLMHNSYYIDRHEDQCKEVINYIIEYLIYGDKHDSSIFDVFCEFNFMNEFIYLASLNNRNINLQIIKSFSVLILNTSNTTTLYFIFSNNFINQIISNDYEKYDDDFISYYVNFLKSLSLKIDTTTVQFFFHKQYNSFPLLQASLKMYNHNDPMIKNTVRNVVLTIMKIKYEPINEYFSSLPCITYFPFLACRLRDLIIKLNEEIVSNDQQALKSIHDDIIDDILYLQDIFSLKLPKINFILINSLFYFIVLPLLCSSLISMTKPIIAISISLYIIVSFCHYIKDEGFINILLLVIFNTELSSELLSLIENYPQCIKNYNFDWNTQKKYAQGSFANYISNNFSEAFIRSIVFQTNSSFPEVIAIIKKYDKIDDLSHEKIFQSLLEDILCRFSSYEIDNMTNFHSNISKACGINVGLITDDLKIECVTFMIDRLINSKGIKNECRENIMSYLRSKDDTLILLVSLLINTIHRKNICKELLAILKLNRADEISSQYDTNKILNELFGEHIQTEENEEININNFDCNNNPIDMDDLSETNKLKQTINEFLSIDNEYISLSKKGISISAYDSEIIDSLLNLLMIEPPFRTITNRLILQNVSSLIIKKNKLNLIERNHLDIINKIYYSFLSNIKLTIINNKFIRETGFELFELEWRNYKQNLSIIIDELISKPFLLIPFNLEDIIEDYPKILRIQKTEVDNFRSNLIIFMTLHDLRSDIYKENDLIREIFPLKIGGCELEPNMSYDLSGFRLEFYQCKLKSNYVKNYMNYNLIIYQNHIYFAQIDLEKNNHVVIKYKYALRHLEAQIDRSDPRILNLIVKDRNSYIDLCLGFDDVSLTSNVKRSLEENRKSSRNTEYLLLDSYFDELINKWKF